MNKLGVVTNSFGNTLDLAFSNILYTEANIEEYFDIGSDYFTLITELLLLTPGAASEGRIKLIKDKSKRFYFLID